MGEQIEVMAGEEEGVQETLLGPSRGIFEHRWPSIQVIRDVYVLVLVGWPLQDGLDDRYLKW
jgi:hypothetical protein